MKLLKLLFAFALFVQPILASAQDGIPAPPSPPRLVNDLTGSFLTPDQVHGLEQKLRAYNDSTSTQIAVVIVNSTGGMSAGNYATELGRKWGVGGKEFNNGIVILVSTGGGDGNRDVHIAVGNGLEGRITDMLSGSIVDNEMIPELKKGNYYRAIDRAVDGIIEAAAGKYKALEGYGKGGKGIPKGWLILAVIAFIVISGMFGGGGGPGTYVSRGGYTPWIGGGWSGGGGGSSGGGFGGFGGGSFGGGGAGGKW